MTDLLPAGTRVRYTYPSGTTIPATITRVDPNDDDTPYCVRLQDGWETPTWTSAERVAPMADPCERCGHIAGTSVPYLTWESDDLKRSLMRQLDAERARVRRLRDYVSRVEAICPPTMANDARIDEARLCVQPGDLEATT